MSRTRLSFRGAASYVVVAAVAMALGALGATAWRRAAGNRARGLDSVTTHGEWVYVRNGTDSIRAYVAYPERKTKAPAIIVIHEIYGVTDWEPTVADRLAKEGFVAILPDLLSSKYPNLRAAVVCYGPPPDTAAIHRIKAPILGVYGENDARITGSLPEVAAEMQSAGKTFTYDVYPGTGHGFLKPGRQGSDGPQVQRAWTRILQFLHARLGK
jgi:dienelactone hydrolase